MPRVDLLYQGHLPKGTPADDLEDLEVLLAKPGPPQTKELRLLLGMLLPTLLPLVRGGGGGGGGEG